MWVKNLVRFRLKGPCMRFEVECMQNHRFSVFFSKIVTATYDETLYKFLFYISEDNCYFKVLGGIFWGGIHTTKVAYD